MAPIALLSSPGRGGQCPLQRELHFLTTPWGSLGAAQSHPQLWGGPGGKVNRVGEDAFGLWNVTLQCPLCSAPTTPVLAPIPIISPLVRADKLERPLLGDS